MTKTIAELTTEDLEQLEKFASPQQARVVELRKQGLSFSRASQQLGWHPDTAAMYMRNLVRKAARLGWSPGHDMDKPVPDGFFVKGVSTLYDGQGRRSAQWVKSQSDPERQREILMERLEEMMTNVKPMKPTTAPRKKLDKSLLAQLTITDFHVGALSWDLETGENWDTEIAKQVFINAVSDALEAAPNAHTGILAQLGDFLHYDSLAAVTPASGHVLDSDSRYQLLVQVALDINIAAIALMLKHFKTVRVIQAEGNHDMAGSIWLRKALKALYADEPRVVIDDTEFPFYAYLHGKTMLAYHHGHKTKLANLPGLFASEPRYREMWGKAKYTYVHTGHYHSERALEDAGALVRQHTTLAARDSYATRLGLMARRGAKLTVYDDQGYELWDFTVRPRHD